MRILVLDINITYSQRLKQYLTKKFSQVQMTICDNTDAVYKLLLEEVFDVVLFDAEFDDIPIDHIEALIGKAAFAYLSETSEIVNEMPTFLKYTRVSELYEKICKLYEEKKGRVITRDGDTTGEGKEIILFLPVCGGAGNTTLAVACSQFFSAVSNVLYVDMEQNPSDSVFFQAEGKSGMSGIATTLRTRYTDSSLIKTIRDCTCEVSRTDGGSLSCIKGYANILDNNSMNPQSMEAFISTIREKFDYRYVILDVDFVVDKTLSKLIHLVDKVVFVSSGVDITESRMNKIGRYLDIIRREDNGEMPNMYLIYNMYKGSTPDITGLRDIRVLSRVPLCRVAGNSGMNSQDVVREILSGRDVFSGLNN